MIIIIFSNKKLWLNYEIFQRRNVTTAHCDGLNEKRSPGALVFVFSTRFPVGDTIWGGLGKYLLEQVLTGGSL